MPLDPWNQPPPGLWWPPHPAGELLRARHSVVPVLGAGFSAGAGLPLGPELAQWLAATFPAFDGRPLDPSLATNCVLVASEIVGPPDEDQLKRSLALRAKVADFYDLGTHSATPTIGAWALVRVPSKLIITLNYDPLLEQAADDQGIDHKSYTAQNISFVNRLVAAGRPKELAIVHVHGRVDEPETIVLDQLGYEEIQNDKRVDDFWTAVTQSKRLCFLGVTLDEPYIVETLGRLQGGSREHVMIADAATLQGFRGRMSLDRARYGINMAELPGHDRVDGFAWKLTSIARAAGAGGPIVERDTDQLDFYISNTLVEPDPYRSEEVSNLLAEWDFDGQLRWRRMFASPQRTFDESSVAELDRALIIGGPGSGKSELMRDAGRRVPDDYIPVFVRLSGVRPRPGNPAVALARWAETGAGLIDDVNVSQEALANTNIHFFLDALDEVPISQQADAVALILEFSSQFPHHRFTVSTRPTEGLDGFMNGRWQLLRIAPTHRWQNAYLDARGLGWERDIEPLLRGINDAREILRLPFFLTRVVDITDQGQLAAQQDLWGLLQALVSDALDREEGELDLHSDEARKWMRRVALTMLLAGRATLTAHEIGQIPLPDSITADHAAVCETLVLRLMLRPSDTVGELGFTHRFFAAALAAEALDELGPTPELLDALVPHFSALISGVRRDALVPLTLLMQRNATWRAAVADRDVIAAGRTTPTSAPQSERQAAARALWDRYATWGVWMWDHDLPEIAEDARALGRLLSSGDIPELVDELRAAMLGTETDARGNAIAVLSFAGLTEIEPDLHDILTDEHAEGVIRRQAALAAARLKLDDLLPLIVTIAATTTDDMVAQDCSLVAIRMAGADNVVQIARDLIQGGNRSSRSIALSHARELATPDEMIELLVDSSNEEDRHSRQADLLLDILDNLQQATAETVRRVALLAAVWQLDAHWLASLFDQHRDAAALGVGDALSEHTIYSWEIMDLLGLFTPDEATTAGWPAEFGAYTRVAATLAPTVVRDPEPPAVAPPADSGPTEPPATPTEDSELATLLKQPRTEAADVDIAHNSQYFAKQAAELSRDLEDDLANRLEAWWPDKPYADTITWNDRVAGQSWRQENGAAAWVWYGPAIDKSLTPTQWAQIAASGVAAFDEQHEWLRRHCTEEAVGQLVGLLRNDDAKVWDYALRAIPGQHELPVALIDAATARVRTGESYSVLTVARRLAEVAGDTPIRELAAISESFADTLRPLLARAGDHETLDVLLADLRHRLERREPVDGDTLGWLDGVGSDPAWLDPLFECLRFAFARPAAGRGARDTVGPLTAAIEQIGTEHPEAVVQRFDDLFLAEPECRWLRGRREGIVHNQLGSLGLAAAAAASAIAQLPLLPAAVDT
jgi:hypothetical protein